MPFGLEVERGWGAFGMEVVDNRQTAGDKRQTTEGKRQKALGNHPLVRLRTQDVQRCTQKLVAWGGGKAHVWFIGDAVSPDKESKTMEITITLPDTFTVQARGEELPIDLAALSAEVIAQGVMHGLKQTVSDAASAAASGAYENARTDEMPDWAKLDAKARKTWATNNAMTIAEYGKVLMQKRVDALMQGEWTTRASAAPGMSRLEETIADILSTKMTFDKGTPRKAKLAKAWEAFGELAPPMQSKVKAMAEARIERDREEAELKLDLTGF